MYPYVRDILHDFGPAVRRGGDDRRCVLGRLAQALDMSDERFKMPAPADGAVLLRELGVPDRYAVSLAEQIAEANDRGNFRWAWRLLHVAHKLVYREYRRRCRAARQRTPLFPASPSATRPAARRAAGPVLLCALRRAE